MRFWRLVAVVAAIAVTAGACTYAYLDENISASCATLEFEINDHDLDPSGTTTAAIVAAFERFGTAVGRPISFLGPTDATHTGRTVGGAVLVELVWPEEAPPYLGYAEPEIVAGEYASGYVLVHPAMVAAPSGLVRRLMLHEIGHLVGLADVVAPDELMDPGLPADDYGPGDIYGIVMTHDGFCS